MTTPSSAPYGSENYDLGTIQLTAFTDDEAEVLGADLAAIDPWKRLGYAPEALSDYLRRADPAACRFAIRADGALAGAVSVRNPWLRGPYLEFLGLLPQSHRHGIGRIVMDWFEAQAPRNAGFLWVVCSDFNTGALAFYKGCGFSEVTRLKGLIFENFTEILLNKSLRPPL